MPVRAVLPGVPVMVLAGLAYGLGGPEWLMLAAIVVSVLCTLPGYLRWERTHRPE
jgi:hypothetical protein